MPFKNCAWTRRVVVEKADFPTDPKDPHIANAARFSSAFFFWRPTCTIGSFWKQGLTTFCPGLGATQGRWHFCAKRLTPKTAPNNLSKRPSKDIVIDIIQRHPPRPPRHPRKTYPKTSPKDISRVCQAWPCGPPEHRRGCRSAKRLQRVGRRETVETGGK